MIQRYNHFCIFKKASGNSCSTTFCVWLFKKNVFHAIFYELTKFHCLIAFHLSGIANMRIAIVCFPGCDVINFQINSIVLIKLFFCMPRISRQKILEVEGIKSVFHHFLKGFQLLLLLLFCFFFPDFLKFFSDLKVRLLSRLATREAITNNYDSFHLWWKRNLAKHQKISKYYDHDCGLSSCVLSNMLSKINLLD